MKLRNKKTGKIIKLDIHCIAGKNYESLAEINDDWEDVPEEPKQHWFIATDGRVLECNEYVSWSGEKQLGNYFETKEEAEQVVEKLKAWKRLKDKGFRFVGVRGLGKVIDFDIPEQYNHIGFDEYEASKDEKEFYDDLLLLFGGEE